MHSPALPPLFMGVMVRPEPAAPKTKRCGLCGEERPIVEFGPDADRTDGLNWADRVCGTLYRAEGKARQENRRVLHAVDQKTYRDAHRAYYVAKSAAHYAAHREERIVAAQKWRDANPAKSRATARRYYLKHRERILEQRREAYRAERAA